MGKENNQSTGIESATIEGKGKGTGEGSGNGNQSTKSTTTRNGKRSGGNGEGTGASPGTNEKEKSLIIPLVETPPLDEKEAERRKKRAEQQRQRRLAKKDQKEGTSEKPKPKAKADPTHIKVLLQTVSMIAATKEGLEHWALSDSEIDQIAKPLSNILSKYEAISNVSTEYADHFALAMAAFAIFFPRIMKTIQTKSKKKEVIVHARKDQHTNPGARKDGESTGEVKASSGSTNRQPTTPTTVVSPILSDLLSPTSF